MDKANDLGRQVQGPWPSGHAKHTLPESRRSFDPLCWGWRLRVLDWYPRRVRQDRWLTLRSTGRAGSRLLAREHQRSAPVTSNVRQRKSCPRR